MDYSTNFLGKPMELLRFESETGEFKIGSEIVKFTEVVGFNRPSHCDNSDNYDYALILSPQEDYWFRKLK